MKTAIAELAQLQPPSEDGAISRALTDLDSKIDAWTSAVAYAQDRIASDMDGITELLEETAAAEARNTTPRVDNDTTGENEISDYESCDESVEHTDELDEVADAVDGDEPLNDVRVADVVEEDVYEDIADVEPDVIETEPECDDDVPLIDASTMRAPTQGEEECEPANGEETGDVIDQMLSEFSPDVAERLKIMHATDENRRSMSDIIAEYKSEMHDADELLGDMDPEAAQAIRVQYRLFNGRKSIRELIDAYQPSNEQKFKSSGKKKSWWRS